MNQSNLIDLKYYFVGIFFQVLFSVDSFLIKSYDILYYEKARPIFGSFSKGA